jgi:hypothetical protein
MKTLAAAGLFILRVCWSGRVAGKFCGAVGMPSSRGSLDRACVGVGRGSPRPTSGSARYNINAGLRPHEVKISEALKDSMFYT